MNPEDPPVWGVVLAAGTGTRFGRGKQFERAGGERLVDRAVQVTAAACDDVVLVLPPGVAWDGPRVTTVVEGGQSRTASVRHALAVLPDDVGIIVLHQAAHPLATSALFDAVLDEVRAGAPAAVPGLEPRDPVRRVVDSSAGQELGREGLAILQTPGAFRADVLRAAHAAGAEAIEDTALLAAIGVTVSIVAGEPWNLHVTTPEELAIADCLLRCRVGAG